MQDIAHQLGFEECLGACQVTNGRQAEEKKLPSPP